MKFLIDSNYSGLKPDIIEKVLKEVNSSEVYPLNRAGKVIEKLAEVKTEVFNKDVFILKKKDVLYKEKVSDTETYLWGYNSVINTLVHCSIVEVDVKRLWTIEEYDGAGYVKYLDNIVSVPSINYCL